MMITTKTEVSADFRKLLMQWEDPTADCHSTAKDVAVLRRLISQSVDGLAWLDQWDKELAEWNAEITADWTVEELADYAEMNATIARGEV